MPAGAAALKRQWHGCPRPTVHGLAGHSGPAGLSTLTKGEGEWGRGMHRAATGQFRVLQTPSWSCLEGHLATPWDTASDFCTCPWPSQHQRLPSLFTAGPSWMPKRRSPRCLDCLDRP